MAIKVLAIDPGRTTGFCQALIENGTALILPWQEGYTVVDMYNLLEEMQPDQIVIEKFQFRKKSQEGLDLYPKELIGVVRLWVSQNPTARTMTEQSASYGMGYYNDVSLKKANIHVPGMPHAMDATRHFLHWFTFGPGFRFCDQKQQYPFKLVSDAQ